MGMGDSNPTFHDIEITEYNYVGSRMGMPSLTATLMWESCLDKEWTSKEYVVLNGERFYIRHTPSSSKNNTDSRYKHELSFVSEYAEILGNTYFVDAVPDLKSGIECQTRNKPCSYNTVFTFYGTISEFVDRLNCAFIHKGIGDSILKSKTYLTTLDKPIGDGFCAMVDPYGDYDKDKTYDFSFEDKKIWEAITESYNKTEIPFERRGRKIIFGAIPNVVSHEFEYGYDNELLSVTKTNANAQVINKITMLGSDENIPYYYPNESEYGHIVIDTPSDNKYLKPEMFEIKHQGLFLSALREGEYLRLHRRPSSAGSVAIDNSKFYTGFHTPDNLTESPAGTIHTLHYNDSPNNETFWYFKVKFNITRLGDFRLSKVMGAIWRTNSGQATIQNLIGSNIYVEKVIRNVTSTNQTDVTDSAIRNAGGTYDFHFGHYGDHEIIFRIPVRIYNREDSFFMIRNVEMEYLNAETFYWTIGDNTNKEYDSLEKVGISLKGSLSANMVGDGFGWTANERIPFQDHLMPSKYIETLGAERFYEAVNLNMVKKSEEIYVEGVSTYSHVGLSFEKIPVFQIGDKFTISVDEVQTIIGSAKEYTVRLYDLTDQIYLTAAGIIRADKKSVTLTIDQLPVSENANIYVILYAGVAGNTSGNQVRYNNVMVVRGDKAMPWHSSVSECGLTEYIDPDTGQPYLFHNPFIEGAPSEHIYKDEDIKPTIENIKNADGKLFGVIADIAYDENDNDLFIADATDEDKNDSAKYEHSYFYIKLNIFSGQYGFDLFKSASQTDPMTIQMTSGNCNGCKFKIQVKETKVDGIEIWENPVQVGVNGRIVDGDYDKKVNIHNIQAYQQNTESNSIWICVQKDAETFGVIMPNQSNNFKPQIGDTFNIINIELPESYKRAAEKRLVEDGIRFMADNNEDKFTFEISASRIFFAERPDILAQLDEYSKIKVRYNGNVYEQYINQFSIDCKDSEALPNIGIGLTDTLAVGQSFVEQVAERASSLIANPTTMGANFGQNNSAGGNYALSDLRYINKQKNDRTPFKLSSDIGFEIGEFVSGSQGGLFYVDPDTGQTYLEVDRIKARMKAIFAELEVAKESSIGGKFDITPGGGIDISFVEELTDSYRCYFKAKDEDKGADCRFVVGDQARCQEVNISNGTTQSASNRYYWRLVTAVNNDDSYIELSKNDCDKDSDEPAIGDTIVQLGNRNDNTRQSAIILSTTDAFAPCVTLYNGINSYSLDGKAVVEYGVDKTKNPPRPFFHCYGDMYIGAKDGSRYLQYTPEGGLIVRGSISSVSTIVDEYGNEVNIEKYVDDSAQFAADKAKSELQSKINELQNQIDGVIETFSENIDPTKNNYPASDWKTEYDKQSHIGDVYFNLGAYDKDKNPNAGHAWRWYYNSSSDYGWTPIADSDAVRALQLAQMSVTATDVLYIQTASQTESPKLPNVNADSGIISDLNGWSTDAPEWKRDKYIWQCTYVRKGDGKATFTNPTCISGKDGKTPNITEQYYLSTSSTQLLGGSWQDNKPTWIAGRYYWTRSKIDYGDGDVEYTEGICVTPENGTSVLAEYSADGTNWHPSFQTGDVWMHTGTDGKNWSTAIRIVGINGSSYTNNLLLNSDFSDNKSHWGFSTGVSIDNSITMDGRSSVLVNISGLSANSYRGITQDGLSHVNSSLMLKGGDVVTASVWTYSDNISSIDSGARLEIKCFDKDGNTLTQKTQPIVLTKNNEWQRFFYTRTLPEGTSRVQVFIYVVKNGKIWISSPKCELGENLDPQWTPAPSEMIGADGKYPKYQWALSTNSSTASNIQDNEWKDSPLTATAGWYVWMRMGMVTPPETEPQSYGTPIRLTGDKGEKGDSVYMLDLSNEVVGIACDTNGNPTSELPTSKVSVYEGSHVSEDWTISLANNGLKGCTAILSNNTIILTKITEDVASVTVQASKSGYSTLTATMNLYKVKPGESGQNGEDAMVFSIYSDVDNITKSFSGELSPNRIRVGKQMTKGSSTAYTPMHNLYYQRIGEDSEEILGRAYGSGALLNIDITDKTESVILTLKSQDNGSVLDSERIPVLTDASDIEIGTRNIVNESASLTINNPTTVYSNNRLQLSQSLKAGEIYAISIGAIYCVGPTGASAPKGGRFMVKIFNNGVTEHVGSLTNIDPNNPRGLIKITANSGMNPWLYIYAGDEETNTRLIGDSGLTINSIQFTKISLVRGNVPLRDWEKAPEDIEEEIKEAVGKFDYLAEAAREDTKTDGGLILTSTISLGKGNKNASTQTTWSGLNGIYLPTAVGGGISAWYGGDMYDLAEYYDWNEAEGKWIAKKNIGNIPSRIAKGIDRMDGSGYRANGNLFWDAIGNTTFIGDIIARGTFRGLRRRFLTVIDSSNISNYSIKDDSGAEYINMDAAGALVKFTTIPSNRIYLPTGDWSYAGETIVIINDSRGIIQLGGTFRLEGTTEHKSSIEIKDRHIFQATCKLVTMDRGLDGLVPNLMWVYEDFDATRSGSIAIPDRDANNGPLDPIV